MDRGVWWATVHSVARVIHNLVILKYIYMFYESLCHLIKSQCLKDIKLWLYLITEKNYLTVLIYTFIGLPWWLSWQRICLQCRRPGFNLWAWGDPWKRERLPTPVFWSGKFHGLHRVHGVTKNRT